MASGDKLLCDVCYVVTESDGDTKQVCSNCRQQELDPRRDRVDDSIPAGTQLTEADAQVYLAH